MILVINPGSTSTKLAIYHGGTALIEEELRHRKEILSGFDHVVDQLDFRLKAVKRFLEQAEEECPGGVNLRAVAGRGGLLHPMQGGVYEVSDDMISDLKEARYGEHPCNLGAILARQVSQEHEVNAYVVDPAVTDELMDAARFSGLPEVPRRSLFHALNQRGVARQTARELGVEYKDANFIVCHMGGGITIGAHRKGQVVDVLNGLDGEGPFTAERTGTLPLLPLLDMLEKQIVTTSELKEKIVRRGGLFAHIGTNDLREAEERRDTDPKARQVLDGLAYAIAKHIGSMAPALTDDQGVLTLTAVILTGGMARSRWLTGEIARMVGYLGPVRVVPGETEMTSLAKGVELVLTGREAVQTYASDN